MRFYDLGDNTYDMAFPLRVVVPDKGLVLSYGKPGAMVFVTTDGYQDEYGREVPGRCVFGTDGETAHSELRDKLGEGETVTMRGVLWPQHDVMTVWQTFDNMSQMRELMKVVASGLRDELGMNPNDILMYLGYSCPPSDPSREFDAFNVELSVAEACTIDGHGRCTDEFHRMFLQDKKARNAGKEKSVSNGMRNRDIWRHYEVVGESTLFADIVREVIMEGIDAKGNLGA